jgi:hypothetical protein
MSGNILISPDEVKTRTLLSVESTPVPRARLGKGEGIETGLAEI